MKQHIKKQLNRIFVQIFPSNMNMHTFEICCDSAYCRCTVSEKRVSQYIFLPDFHFQSINLFFNRQILLILLTQNIGPPLTFSCKIGNEKAFSSRYACFVNNQFAYNVYTFLIKKVSKFNSGNDIHITDTVGIFVKSWS